MAHGQAPRPIESTDGSTVSMDTLAGGRSALAVSDPGVSDLLVEMLAEMKKVRLALEILIEQEITDEV